MRKKFVAYLHTEMPVRHPVLDVLGKWVYLPNPRVASMSILLGPLHERCIVYRRGKRNWHRVWKQVILPRIDDLQIFTFVRNPWGKVCSAFYKCRDYMSDISVHHRIDKQWSFKRWIKGVLAKEGIDNIHFCSQYDLVCCEGELIPNIFIGRFENIDEDWATLASKTGLMPTLTKGNSSHHSNYVEHYDKETRDIVADIYAPEIELFGYEFGK